MPADGLPALEAGLVVCEEDAAVAVGAEGFGRLEGCGCHVAERADAGAGLGGAEGLGCVGEGE